VLPVVRWKKYLLSPDPTVRCWALLLCRACRACTAVDLSHEQARVDTRLRDTGFAPRRYSVESEGRCIDCGGGTLREQSDGAWPDRAFARQA